MSYVLRVDKGVKATEIRFEHVAHLFFMPRPKWSESNVRAVMLLGRSQTLRTHSPGQETSFIYKLKMFIQGFLDWFCLK